MENEAVKEIIKTKELTFDYIRHDEEGNEEGTIRAVDNVSLEVKQGDFIAILGHNGSGKSTLAKHINALLVPTSGTVWVDGRVTAGLRTGEHGSPHKGNLGTRGGKPEGSGNVRIQEVFAQ